MGTDLEKALLATQERLEEAGVSDALVREVLSYRLLIERLGETDNNSWWDSIVLTDTGRDRLGEVTPQTAVKSTIDLAQRIGRKAEQDRLDSNSISLFYLGPTVEAAVYPTDGLVMNDDAWRDTISDTARARTRAWNGEGVIGIGGHSHKVMDEIYEGVRVLNPGSATGREVESATMMTAEIDDDQVEVALHEAEPLEPASK